MWHRVNIRSLPKHGGELFFFERLKHKFNIIILTENVSKNISCWEIVTCYNFQYESPEKNKCGGVGIYNCVVVMNDVSTECENESLLIEFC